MRETSQEVHPFEITLGDVETFVPITPTIFIRVAHAAYRMRELHDRLNRDGLATLEQWPYMPHVTIAKLNTEEEATEAQRVARERWAQFAGERSVRITELTFVRESSLNCWVDLARFPLGRTSE
jgi:2'-5' RNA ligase